MFRKKIRRGVLDWIQMMKLDVLDQARCRNICERNITREKWVYSLCRTNRNNLLLYSLSAFAEQFHQQFPLLAWIFLSSGDAAELGEGELRRLSLLPTLRRYISVFSPGQSRNLCCFFITDNHTSSRSCFPLTITRTRKTTMAATIKITIPCKLGWKKLNGYNNTGNRATTIHRSVEITQSIEISTTNFTHTVTERAREQATK